MASSRATNRSSKKSGKRSNKKNNPASLLSNRKHESDDSDSTDVISSSDEEDRWRETKRSAEDLPPEYWNIQKLVKYIKAGNPTATMVSLCCLKDFDLTTQINQMVFNVEQQSDEFPNANNAVCFASRPFKTSVDWRS